VISAIGRRGTGPTTVIRDSVRSIIQAMEETDTRRFVQVSGSVVADEGESPYMRYLARPVARRMLLRHVSADMHAGEDEIRRSDLDWTILRPPSLNGKAAAGTYRTAIDRNLPHGFKRLPRRPGGPAFSRCSTTRRPCTSMWPSPTDSTNVTRKGERP